jgi:hypothetical protein
LTSTTVRHAGGSKIHKIPDSQTEFDVVVVGGSAATALTKFWQNDHTHEQVALITDKTKFCKSELYHLVNVAGIPLLQYETDSVNA